MKLIVGLGNPGRRYASTPHNVGYEVVDEVAARAGLKWRKARRLDAEWTDGEVAGADCMLLKPTTFMNASGEAVWPLVRGERLDPAADLMVTLDDVALRLGRLRVRREGSSGGHKGLESIIQKLGTPGFARLRCGVWMGNDEPTGHLAGYVLGRWPKSAREAVEEMVDRAADAVERWLTDDMTTVMNEFNTKESRTSAS